MILILEHIDIEGPGSMGEFFRNTAWQLQTLCLHSGEELPKDTQGIEAVFSLGGPMNVYETERYPFLAQEESFLRMAVQEGIPVLGICLGAQLLAKALGAKVIKLSEKEIGWHEISLTEEGRKDALFAHLPKRFPVYQWHEDAFEIPPGAAKLASSEICETQAFKAGENCYGLQFHMEVSPEMIVSWIGRYIPNATQGQDAQEMLRQAYLLRKEYMRHANLIYLNFARIISNAKKAMVFS
jgi:GMP synthase (glutamine-hydrolysing)